MPGNQFLVVTIQLCSACKEKLWRAMDTWVEADNYADCCLAWIANGYNNNSFESFIHLKRAAEQKIQKSIKALRARIFDWVTEQRLEIN